MLDCYFLNKRHSSWYSLKLLIVVISLCWCSVEVHKSTFRNIWCNFFPSVKTYFTWLHLYWVFIFFKIWNPIATMWAVLKLILEKKKNKDSDHVQYGKSLNSQPLHSNTTTLPLNYWANEYQTWKISRDMPRSFDRMNYELYEVLFTWVEYILFVGFYTHGM